MNASVKATFKNNYHVELIEAATGIVKQSGDFHNIAVNGFYDMLLGSTEALGRYIDMFYQLRVGSGTNTPAVTDTALTNYLWTAGGAATFTWVDDYTGRGVCTYTFPATSDYVGTVAEVGLWCRNRYNSNTVHKMVTRSLLTDSEGQVISFQKTDLDILKITVTVELTLSSSSEHFKIFKRNFLTRNIIAGESYETGGSGGEYGRLYGYVDLCRYYADLELSNAKYDRSIDQSISSTPSSVISTTEHYIAYPVSRLPATTITSERYYKAIAISGIGYWKLPNEEIFPAYNITGISIGTGDGETTQFTNPLCYFKAGTDKVYKNGVQLTKGTDYTINNVGNKDCLPEVAELDFPIKVKSDLTSVTTLSRYPLFVATAQDRSTLAGTVAGSTLAAFSKTFSPARPLYIEYTEVMTFNCLKCVGNFVAFSGTNGYNNVPVGSTIFIDYSANGVDYVELGSYTTTSTTEHSFSLDFADTTAKYWRLRISTTVSGEVGFSSNYSGEQFICLNKKDPYITFTEAPADGDVLTMDVSMDIIMKNANFVVDAGCTIYFQF